MKKTKKLASLVLAMIMCLTLCVPAMAVTTDSTNNDSRPPCVEENETWFPANGIMPMEDESCRLGHQPPKGYYIYEGKSTGNTSVEGNILGATLLLIGFIPGLGTISGVCALALLPETVCAHFATYPNAPGMYTKYLYSNGKGSYYYHVIWHSATGHYMGCADGMM